MDAGLIGSATLWGAALASLTAIVSNRRWPLRFAAALLVIGTATLVVALLGNDFSLVYVAETTSLATPWPYRLAALWGGMDGSMLFYTALTGVFGTLAARRAPVRAVAIVALGLVSITMLFANPFHEASLPAVDGRGLLAILQHPAMIYHPPILYLGLSTTIVPFAMLFAAHGDRGSLEWARRWVYVSWGLLTLGMAAGANWAYVELGWGGFWAWDPVENTALMPWLAATIFLHSARVQQDGGRLRRWTTAAAGMPFALSVLGIYLTRSGSTGSIHSFAEDPVVGRILLAGFVLVMGLVVYLALREPGGESWGRLRLDRDGWILLNTILLSAALVFITAGSAYPAFMSVFGGETVVVDARFFVVTIMPIAVVVAASLTLALRRRWWPVLSLGAIAVAAITVAMVGPRPGVWLIAPAVASLVSLAFAMTADRPRGRRLVAHIAHLGMALLLAALAGSSFGAEFTGTMRPGESVEVGGHRVELIELSTGEADRYVFVRAQFEVDESTLVPEIRAYEEQASPVAEPALRSNPIDDVTVAISLLFPDGETVDVSVFVRPLVWWVWVGAGLIGLAALVFLVGIAGDAARPRRSATAGLRRAGTTSGTPAR